MNSVFRDLFATYLILGGFFVPLVSQSPSSLVRFELPAQVEMQERAGLTVSGTFVGSSNTSPVWIAQPSGEWIRVQIQDSGGKLLIDRRLWPYAPGRTPVITPTPVYARLGFPVEVLSRCEPLPPGKYRLRITYDSPATSAVLAVSQSMVLPLTVRSDAPVPLRHLSLEAPSRVLHEDLRDSSYGIPVRVVNDGCEAQEVVPFTSDMVSIQARSADGRMVSCRPAVSKDAPRPVQVQPGESWGVLVLLSGRCDISLPTGANERARYNVQIGYRGPGWTGPALRLNHNAELELANLPHSGPSSRGAPGRVP